MKKPLIINTLFSFVKISLNVIVIKLCSIYLSTDSFSQILYIRRLAPIVAEFLHFGFSKSLIMLSPRKILSQKQWLGLACQFIVISTLISLLLFCLTDGDNRLIFILTLTLSIDYIVRSFFISRLEMLKSNIIESLTSGIILTAVIVSGYNEVWKIISLSSFINISILAYFLIKEFLDIKGFSVKIPIEKWSYVIKFGIPRTITGISEMCITSLPIAILGASSSKNLNLAIALCRLSVIFIYPITEVLIVKLNQLLSAETKNVMPDYSKWLPKIIIASYSISLVFYCLSPYILENWVGKEYDQNLQDVAEVMCYAIPGLIIFTILRGLIDSIMIRPYTFFVSTVILVCTTLYTVLRPFVLEVALVIALSYCVLGLILIYVYTKVLFNVLIYTFLAVLSFFVYINKISMVFLVASMIFLGFISYRRFYVGES